MQRQQVEELTYAVNNMLTLYVEVHDGIFTHPWWRSIPIPGLFKKIDFARYAIQISHIEKQLSEVEVHIAALYAVAMPNEKEFVGALHQYTKALIGAEAALAVVVRRMHGKTEGQPYSLSEYHRDVAIYKEAEKPYHALGADMNRIWLTYQHEHFGN